MWRYWYDGGLEETHDCSVEIHGIESIKWENSQTVAFWHV